jgi:hypothetical protein
VETGALTAAMLVQLALQKIPIAPTATAAAAGPLLLHVVLVVRFVLFSIMLFIFLRALILLYHFWRAMQLTHPIVINESIINHDPSMVSTWVSSRCHQSLHPRRDPRCIPNQ